FVNIPLRNTQVGVGARSFRFCPQFSLQSVKADARAILGFQSRRAKRPRLNLDSEFAVLLGVEHVVAIDSRAACNLSTDILDVHVRLLVRSCGKVITVKPY